MGEWVGVSGLFLRYAFRGSDSISYTLYGDRPCHSHETKGRKVIKEGIVNLVRTDCNATAWGERRDSHSLGHAIRTAQTRHLPHVFEQRDGTTIVGWTAASFARNPAPPTDEHVTK